MSCPNRCVNGFYINPYTHKKEICQYCAKERKEKVLNKDTDIREELNLPEYYLGYSFDADAVIPKSALKNLSEESVELVKTAMTDLIGQVSIGTIPDESMLFNFGSKVVDGNFTFPLVVRAYMSGLKVSPVLMGYDLYQYRLASENGYEEDNTYRDLLDKDICVVVLDAGSTKNDILCVKGFMQLRGYNRKPTIIIANVWKTDVLALCNEEDTKEYSLATLYGVEYLGKETVVETHAPESSGFYTKKRGMTMEEFNRMKQSSTNL